MAIALIGQIFLLTASAQVKYTITRLVPLEEVRSSAGGINSQGDAVGNYFWRSAPNTSHVFLNHAGIMHDIGSFGDSTFASKINIYGRIVGQANQNPQTVAYTYFEHQFWLLKNLSSPMGVNTAGHVLTIDGIWQKSGFTAFAAHAGKAIIAPLAINNLDQVAGYLIDQNTPYHALLYSGGQAIDLGTLPGGINFTSLASGINDEGQVTGYSDSTMGVHAFLYTSGRMQDIHSIGPQYTSLGGGINNLGQVVGILEDSTPNGLGRAFLYAGSQMVDLNMLIAPNSGWVLNYALAINDAGQILGDGVYNGENYQEAFLLTSVR